LEPVTLLPVAEAAELVGKSRPALMKAIRKGRISATRDAFGRWMIDPAELTRVYRIVKPANSNRVDEVADGSRQVIGALQGQIELLKAQNDDLLQQRDLWQQQAPTLALAGPRKPASFWDRLTGRSSS
jgi:predicted site-specific integrase-resolvase